MKKQSVLQGKTARKELKKSLEKFVNIVATSYGFNGKNTIMEAPEMQPLSTNDGIRILNSIEPKTTVERVAKKLLLDIAEKTEAIAGDGTTTAVLLAGTLSCRVLDLINKKKVTAQEVETFLNKFMETSFKEHIKSSSFKIKSKKDAYKLAYISSRSKNIAKLLSEFYTKTTDEVFAEFKDNRQNDKNEIDIFKGTILDADVFSADFWEDNIKLKTTLKNPKIIVTTKTLNSVEEVFGRSDSLGTIVDLAIKNGWTDILLVCNNIEEEKGNLLPSLIDSFKKFNPKEKNQIRIFPVRSPYDFEKQTTLLTDFCTMVGATLVDNHQGMSMFNLKEEYFGEAKKIVVTPKDIRISGTSPNMNKVKERRDNLQTFMTDPEYFGNQSLSNFLLDRKKILSSERATLLLAGKTATETGDLMTRGQDALNTITKARKDGYVIGGGAFYLKLINKVLKEDNSNPFLLFALVKMLSKPFDQLFKNSNQEEYLEGLLVSYFLKRRYWVTRFFSKLLFSLRRDKNSLNKQIYDNGYSLISDNSIGVNFETGEITNLIEGGVIDSVATVSETLYRATSLAKTLAKTENIFSYESEELPKKS